MEIDTDIKISGKAREDFYVYRLTEVDLIAEKGEPVTFMSFFA
jgi:hypothetical protein